MRYDAWHRVLMICTCLRQCLAHSITQQMFIEQMDEIRKKCKKQKFFKKALSKIFTISFIITRHYSENYRKSKEILIQESLLKLTVHLGKQLTLLFPMVVWKMGLFHLCWTSVICSLSTNSVKAHLSSYFCLVWLGI